MSPDRARREGTLTVALLLLAAPLLADWRASFREGVKAYDQERWEEVARHMKAAIEERPSDDPDRISIFSNRFVSYIPNAYLGMALAKLGRCEEALPYFDQAEVQRVAPDREKDKYRPMLQERLRCINEMMARVTDAAEKALASAQAAATQVTGDAALAAVIDAQPDLKRRRQEALDQLRAANEGAVAAIQASHPPSVRQAESLAKSAEQAFVALRRDAASRRDSGAVTATRDAQQKAEQAIARARTARDGLAALRRQQAAADAWRGDQTLARGEQSAIDQLRQAEELLGKGGAGADDYGRALSLAERAASDLDNVTSRLREKVAGAQRAAEQETADVVRALENAIAAAERSQRDVLLERDRPELRQSWSGTRELGGREQQLVADLERARGALRNAQRDPAAARAAVDLANATDRGFRDLVREARSSATASPSGEVTLPGGDAGQEAPAPTAPVLPPPALRQAVDAYFRGEYPRTLELLEDLAAPPFADARVLAQAHLFRAAASFALYRMGGDETQRRAAIDAIGRAKAAEPSVRPSEKYFPPPFLELFGGGGG